jgi:hypothetical protein
MQGRGTLVRRREQKSSGGYIGCHTADSLYDLVAFDGTSTVNVSERTFHRDIQWD